MSCRKVVREYLPLSNECFPNSMRAIVTKEFTFKVIPRDSIVFSMRRMQKCIERNFIYVFLFTLAGQSSSNMLGKWNNSFLAVDPIN